MCGTDLTKLAKEGRFDPVFGRQKQVDQLVQILIRRSKNNPCLVGEPGVGKTAIVEGISISSDSCASVLSIYCCFMPDCLCRYNPASCWYTLPWGLGNEDEESLEPSQQVWKHNPVHR